MGYERKLLVAGEAELKFRDGDNEPTRVAGYASVFGGDPDAYGDLIAPGAYADTVMAIKAGQAKGRHLPMLYQHNPEIVIGHWTSVKEDHHGLRVEGTLAPGNSDAGNVAALLRHGSITGLSIGYKAKKADRDGKGIRTLKAIDLREVSIVCSPANAETRITAVKAADEIDNARDFEAWLREEGGYSHRETRIIANQGFKAMMRARDEPSCGDSTDERRDDGKAVESWLSELKNFRVATP